MLDPKLIRRLARIMSGEGLTELQIDDKEAGLNLTLKRGDLTAPASVQPFLHMMPGGMQAMPQMQAPMAAGAAPAGADREDVLPAGIVMIESPMVGTFYRSPSPESDPFAEVGTRVDVDKVVCIIEAMKVMNEIKAEVKGVITEILVSDGDPVEFGQPLFLVKKD